MRSNRGQALPYFLIMMLVLVMSWAMVVNIAKLARDRIMMQNAADNAALSAAVFRARTMNLIGEANYLMSVTLASGAFPCLVPVPLCNIDYVGGSARNIPFPFSDVNCHGGVGEYSVEYGGVNRLRYTVNMLARFQQLLVLNYIPGTIRIAHEIGRRQEINAAGVPSGADEVVVIPGELASSIVGQISGGGAHLALAESIGNLSPEKLLGIERITKKISYYKTINLGTTIFEHYHAVIPQKWRQDDVAWYKTRDTFFQQKLVAIAVKRSASPSNAGYPWFGRMFNATSWPTMVTVAAAAIYNTGTEMFPTTDQEYTGIPEELIAPAVIETAVQLGSMYRLAQTVNMIPGVGQVLGMSITAATTAVAAIAAIALEKAINDENTPVKKYERARYCGWDAHLVPVGEASLQH
ncbi:MAG: pilus assembly protein TadG-related protein [Elusimicrobia bacterium]|nr:pilus assembly protein TadG-related protein [Elusimicrobiota bacterium]